MKKVLFATTALVASAGIASAQGVSLSGSAEMGIIGGDGFETQFHTDIDVTFTMSGETDNGLTFGANVDLDESDGSGVSVSSPAFGNRTQGGESIFLSGNFGTITMGDTDGAFDWALQEVGIGSAIADDHTTHAGFSGNGGLDGTYDGQIARYNYSFGDFAFAVSAELDDTGVGDPVIGVGGKYSGDLGGVKLGVGLGYQTTTAQDIVGVSLDARMSNGLRGIVNYDSRSGTAAAYDTHIAFGLGYSMDALTVSMNYGVFDNLGATPDSDGYGFAANYNLGGGASIQAGYGSGSIAGAPDVATYSLGIAMSF
jgi:outer membrane protein OmpU